MTIERKIADLFRLNDEARNRHAHPWSVISRSIVLPILIIAFWSRLWLWYWAVIPFILALVRIWLNPKIFSAPDSFDHRTHKSGNG